MNPDSPFSKFEPHDIKEPYSYKANIPGLLLPNGRILCNFNPSTSHFVLVDVARIMEAKLVGVKGTWTFVPDIDDDGNPIFEKGPINV
jgi:hypothetical protein